MIKVDSLPEEEECSSMVSASDIDAAFHIPGQTHLRLDTHGWHDKAAEYLDHAIARSPEDLRSHVQRVYLQIKKKHGDNLFGALLDLFIALGDAGRSLRQGLLENSRTILDDQSYQFLVQRLAAGIRPIDPTPSCRASLLSKGLSGTSQLVIIQDDHEPLDRDPMQEAREHIEYGQIDEAREVLEAAILRNPERPELHLDLLEIYQSTQAKAAFQSMWQRLDADLNPAAAAWRELADHFALEKR